MKKDLHYCILGFGVTGISCLNFLIKKKIKKITITDHNNINLNNINNLNLKKIKKNNNIKFILGEFKIPEDADLLILSPGIDPRLPAIQHAIQRGAEITNDLNIFLEQINILKKSKKFKLSKPFKIAAVTGTNGKTTVVNILADMAKCQNIKYALGGNVGEPVLNYLINNSNNNLINNINLYILELSSFQLELINKLSCELIFDVACVLNITPDHLDRYEDFAAYSAAKLNIYKQAKHKVYYQDNKFNAFGIDATNTWLIHNQQNLLPIAKLSLFGEHNVLNALACLAIGENLGFTVDNMLNTLQTFKNLAHRCELIGNFNGIMWINDSKGTNIGATIAAINSIIKNNKNNKLIIILGGVNKNIDLALLKPAVIDNCKAAILIGACKQQLFEIFNKNLDCHIALDLEEAVCLAKKLAITQGDIVLFSPACASFDMFENYKHRGEVFKKCVLNLNQN